MKRFLLSFLIILTVTTLYGQLDGNIKVNYHGYMDNRELFNPFAAHGTFFGNRLALSNEFIWNKQHTFEIGGDVLKEFGNPLITNPLLILNYGLTTAHFDFKLGSFQRYGAVDMPEYMMKDTLRYFEPLIEGMYFKYNSNAGRQHVWLDWESRQQDTISEKFVTGMYGIWNVQSFFVENYFVFHHLAKSGDRVTNNTIHNYAAMAIHLGYDIEWSALDSSSFTIGALFSKDRLRGAFERTGNGWMVKAILVKGAWRFNGLYFGGNDYIMDMGEKMYWQDSYTRLDLNYQPFRKGRLKLELQLTAHIVPGYFDHAQLVRVLIDLEQPYRLNPRTSIN